MRPVVVHTIKSSSTIDVQYSNPPLSSAAAPAVFVTSPVDRESRWRPLPRLSGVMPPPLRSVTFGSKYNTFDTYTSNMRLGAIKAVASKVKLEQSNITMFAPALYGIKRCVSNINELLSSFRDLYQTYQEVNQTSRKSCIKPHNSQKKIDPRRGFNIESTGREQRGESKKPRRRRRKNETREADGGGSKEK